MARDPTQALVRVVLELAVEDRIRVEPNRGIRTRLLALDRGLFRELDRVRIG